MSDDCMHRPLLFQQMYQTFYKICHIAEFSAGFAMRRKIKGDDFYYKGDYGKRPYQPGTDVDVCFSGKIAVTLIKL